ncbi:MAG: hypothetical protein KGJ78_07325 [Alphaproteobacteria bacterium]|nr:hypothetical protein [Alphaproteobacteria bacterium]
MLVAPVSAIAKDKAPKGPAQAIASWTENLDYHTEHSLSLHAGTLTAVSILFDPSLASDYPNGDRAELAVKLARIKAINTGVLHDGIYSIGIESKGPHDIAYTEQVISLGKRVSRWGSREDFTVFDSTQKDLRDAVYGKLCALVNPGVCVGERK